MSSEVAKRFGGIAPLLALLLVVSLSFWLSPVPQGQPDVEYWGHYARVGPGLGFIVNHDSYGYLEVAQEPHRLLLPQEVRQSRPLYALLGATVGYPLTAALRLAARVGLAPAWPPADFQFYGFYSGYVLLNALTLLASLLLFRQLFYGLAGERGQAWQFYTLAWVLVATPITKAFFWTAHQQMLAFLVPLFCLLLALRLGQRPLTWRSLTGLSLLLGLLPLVYGSFVLAWPALAYGVARPVVVAGLAPGRWKALAGRLLLSAVLFGLPTLLWIALLRLHGTTYYNHEAVRYHQLVWLFEATSQPGFRRAVLDKLGSYLASLQVMSWWLLGAASLLAATWWGGRRPPPRGGVAPGRGVGVAAPPTPGAGFALGRGCGLGLGFWLFRGFLRLARLLPRAASVHLAAAGAVPAGGPATPLAGALCPPGGAGSSCWLAPVRAAELRTVFVASLFIQQIVKGLVLQEHAKGSALVGLASHLNVAALRLHESVY
jgi:hypothetical protein